MTIAFFFSVFASARAASFSARIVFSSAWASALAVAAAAIRALASSTFLLFPAFLSAAFFEFISDLAALYLASVNADFLSTAFLFCSACMRATFRSVLAFASACALFVFAAAILAFAFARFRLAFSRSVTVFAFTRDLSAILAFSTALILLASAAPRAASFSARIVFNSPWTSALAVAAATIRALASSTFLLFPAFLSAAFFEFISDLAALYLASVNADFLSAVFLLAAAFFLIWFLFASAALILLCAFRRFCCACAFSAALSAVASFTAAAVFAFAALFAAARTSLSSRCLLVSICLMRMLVAAAAAAAAVTAAAAAVAAIFLFLDACSSCLFNSFVAEATAVSVLFVRVVTSLVNASILFRASLNSLVNRVASATVPLLACSSKSTSKALIRTLSWLRWVSISPIRCSPFSTCNVTAFKSD